MKHKKKSYYLRYCNTNYVACCPLLSQLYDLPQQCHTLNLRLHVNINFNHSLPKSSRMRFTSCAQGGWTVVVIGAFGEGNLPASFSTPLQESLSLLRDQPVHSGIRLQLSKDDRTLHLLPLCIFKINLVNLGSIHRH